VVTELDDWGSRAEGLTLSGQLVGVDEAYSFTGRDGSTVEMKPAIKLLVAEHIEKIPFDPTRVDVRLLVGDAVKGDVVTLPVRAFGPYDPVTARSAPVRYRVWTRTAAADAPEPA